MSKELLEYFAGDELAANVWKSKYALEGEATPDAMHWRMAKEFARVDFNHPMSDDVSELSDYGKILHIEYLGLSENDLAERYYNLFKDFKYIIPQGSIMANLGSGIIASLSNCFVIGTDENSYGAIMRIDEEQIQLMKRRGGVGHDLSALQPEETVVNNAARTSTGAVSFMHRYSESTREVAQNGRRGALMLSISINHPDSLHFIKIKRDLTKITGANVSVKVNDAFMEAVEKDEDYILRYPTTLDKTTLDRYLWDNYEYNKLYNRNRGYIKRIKAKEYWNELVKSAHQSAEPGILFWDTVTGYSPDGVYTQFAPVTTNPCGEIPLQPYDACRLMVTNLYSFITNPFTAEAEFDFEKFYRINYEAMRLMDNLIDLEVEHINRIIDKIKSDPESEYTKSRELGLWEKILATALASRRTGLGFTALGDMLAAMNISYNSAEALVFVKKVMHTKMESELDCTIDMAVTRGTFEGWDNCKEFDLIMSSKDGLFGQNDFYKFIARKYPLQADRMMEHGRRNLSWSTVAPTGSVSLLTQTTSGVEPLFSPYHIRRKKINPSEKGVRVDFVDDMGDSWQEFPVLHEKFKEWIEVQNNEVLKTHTEDYDTHYTYDLNDKDDLEIAFEQSPWFNATANDIAWEQRVSMQSLIQRYISHSISSTVNLPESVSKEEVSNIYLSAWKEGLKGITVYRDGSRSGVLVNSDDKGVSKAFEYKDAPKRPKALPAEGHTTVANKVKYNVIVGFMDDKPYEVFMFPFANELTSGGLSKVKRGNYAYIDHAKDIIVSDLTGRMSNEQEAITRLVSTSLRHGANIKFIVEQLRKVDGDMFSFTKGLARILSKYVSNGSKSTVSCDECGSEDVIFEEGCSKCLSCGHSACS